MPKMDANSLKALLADQRSQALASARASKLSSERTRALNYYLGDVSDDIPDVTGRSKVVSMDVADTVHGLLPSLMEIFAGSDDAVRFEPVGPEDVDAADQETEYVKHIFWNKNDGYKVLYSMIFDALLMKTGIGKVSWEETEEEEKETYYGMSPEEFAMIASAPDVEVIEHSETQDQYGMPAHDVTVVQKKTYACAKVEAVPPEEFGISRRARCVRDTGYCFHEPQGGVPAADLIAQGYDAAQVNKLATYNSPKETESFARDTIDETNEPQGDEGLNKAMRPIRVTEHYIRMDYEGDGKAKLYRVVTGGEDSTILKLKGKPDIQEWDMIPFAVITPYIMPHRVFGRSIADIVIDIQQQKTVLKRGTMDNLYAVNMPRPEVAEDLSTDTTMDDLLVWRHGAPIRSKQPGAVTWQMVPFVGQHTFPMMQYIDMEREWRTGVSRQGQGLDADALNNQTATAAMQMFNVSQMRMKMVARNFAETGIKDLFWLLHATIRKHAKQAETVRLTNKWVPIDPRNWKTRNDLTVSVGLGQGGKTERLQELNMIAMYQEKLALGGYDSMVKPKQMYNTAREMCKVLEKEVDLFVNDPGDEENPDKPSPEEMKAKTEIMKAQLEAQFRQKEMESKAQIEALQADADIATQDRKTGAEIALAERKFQLEAYLKQQEFEMERELKWLEHGMHAEKTAVDMQHESHKAELGLATDTAKAEMGLASDQVKADQGERKANMDNAIKAEDHARKGEVHKQKLDEAKAKAKAAMPMVSTQKQLSQLMDRQQKTEDALGKILEAVEAEREIEVKRDAKGKPSGAVSRRKKKP